MGAVPTDAGAEFCSWCLAEKWSFWFFSTLSFSTTYLGGHHGSQGIPKVLCPVLTLVEPPTSFSSKTQISLLCFLKQLAIKNDGREYF